MRSCERPRKRSASEALPSSVSNRYFLSIRTHGSSCRRRASSSLRRVRSFSASSSSRRAASHSSCVPVMCFVIALLLFLRVSFIDHSLPSLTPRSPIASQRSLRRPAVPRPSARTRTLPSVLARCRGWRPSPGRTLLRFSLCSSTLPFLGLTGHLLRATRVPLWTVPITVSRYDLVDIDHEREIAAGIERWELQV